MSTITHEECPECFICSTEFEISKQFIIPCSHRCKASKTNPVHIKCIYEWQERSGTDSKLNGTCPFCRSNLNEIDYRYFDNIGNTYMDKFSFRKNFVTYPTPKNVGMVRGYLKINNDITIKNKYEFYIQRPTMLEYPLGKLPTKNVIDGDKLILVAKRVRDGVLDISLDINGNDYETIGPNFCGRVVSSFTGLKHTIKEPYCSVSSNKKMYKEIGSVHYSQNRFGKGIGPRNMNLSFPNVEKIDDNWKISRYIPSDKSRTLSKMITNKKKRNKNRNSTDVSPDNSIIFSNNVNPHWNDIIGAYSLDFDGRVTLASNKNFKVELENFEEQKEVCLQFGKIINEKYTSGTEIYTCDFQWPLSPLQVFGICLTSCVTKLGCA